MNKNLFSFLFIALFTAGCQQNVAPSSGSGTSLENAALENAEASTQETEPDYSVAQPFQVQGVEQKIEEKPLTPAERLTLRLVQKGEVALAEQRLLTPVDDHANLYFQAALGRDPGNFRATQGIANIVETYTDWAWKSALGRGYRKADEYLDSARSVNPQDPLITEMDSRIRDLKVKRANDAKYAAQKAKERAIKEQKRAAQEEKQRQAQASANRFLPNAQRQGQEQNTNPVTDDAEQKQAAQSDAEQHALEPSKPVYTPAIKINDREYLLPKNLFSLSDDEIIAKMQPIIDDIAYSERSIIIRWPKDKEARLIYQIINSRVFDFRVRAMTFRQSDYTIELED